MLEKPGELAGRVIGVERQTRAFADRVFESRATKTLDDRDRAPALPADRWRERSTILGIPGDDRLALVGEPCRDDASRTADLLQDARDGMTTEFDDRLRVLFDPTRRGWAVSSRNAAARDRPEASVEGDRAR